MSKNSGAIYLTISSCLSAATRPDLDNQGAEFNTGLSSLSLTVFSTFTFINTGRGAALISDGTNSYMVTRSGHRGSTIVCSCITSNLLTCDASVTPVLFQTTDATLASRPSSECVSISADSTYDMSGRQCAFGSAYCPSCWILDTSSNTVSLTLTNCNNYFKIDVGSNNAIMSYTFVNTGSNAATLSDGTNDYTLSAQGTGTSHTHCLCHISGASHLLACDVPAIAATGSTPINTFPQDIQVATQVRFGGTTTYLNYVSGTPALEMYVGSNRALSGTSTAGGSGILHGTWNLDAATVTSDARFKRDIEPLRTTLKRVWHRGKDGSQKESNEKEADEADESKIFDWVLNRLRPVSYVPTRDQTHGRRFGFIAQELEEVFPEMVRDLNLPSADHKTVHLLDLIALVVAAAQQQSSQLRSLQGEDKSTSEQLHALEKRLSRVEELEARVAHLEKTVATFLTAGSPPASPDT
ncbi:unnamed protein product [Symbiodinium sp. CCMP2592]|nr:unnamed protein product [Symbiodinium sp. CCMP2592]